MSNPYAAIYPPSGKGHPDAQQPIATAPPPGMFPVSQPHPNAAVTPQGGWSPPNTIYPSGLEYLMGLDYLFVNQKVELLEVFTGFETKNRYAIMDVTGKPVFYAAEESDVCSRLCLGSARPCDFSVVDLNGREVLRMSRPFRCDSCCCPCCLQIMEIYSGNLLLGTVTQEWSLWRPTFTVRDATGNPVLIIKGPIIRFCIEVVFKVKSLDEKQNVGVIQKNWGGFSRELFTDADRFGVQFPRDLDVKIKAVLLGACLLLDFMYFENRS
ncbi:PREDICTED: phospholipid scramblase 2-like [Dinoponera quadriceps]|uniref:Phospholipid scramblase n=1 Tax=Dinoponera quadriceps TaxID=609295 RepID=A0A6P3WMM9_DINQU|nr:PREDICTED: phospholipid scramblase 2-like [Dinoponera quadriceps]XP_014467350.1 PREDICTED: phospholipid scramblase 2-like [Dinoponera quadriceps]XP_014467351.1 PREDICTED: phospholipid scramblase 2-like [Dinoponera quadriceps]XP_014467352.1 PREDICTED: phospholipid scramblase 2-like [Dinoponera quadriceps]XP_014467353.1 PREDICTED: phospholipid scramblase 2-like [Dinoponera quadriceps]